MHGVDEAVADELLVIYLSHNLIAVIVVDVILNDSSSRVSVKRTRSRWETFIPARSSALARRAGQAC